MTNEEFTILATKALTGAATADEAARLESALEKDASWRAEFTALQASRTWFKEFGPLLGAVDAPPTPIPEARLRELQRLVRNELRTKPAGEALVVPAEKRAVRPSSRPRQAMTSSIFVWFENFSAASHPGQSCRRANE